MSLLKSTLALLLGFCFICLVASAETYYIITQTANNTCPNKNATCLTLTAFAQQSQRFALSSNVILMFEPGNHHLGVDLRIQNITSLVLKQYSTANVLLFSDIVVTCKNTTGFIFEAISEVSIESLEFNGCIYNAVRYVDHFGMEDCRFHTGHGIELDTVVYATISRSSFVSLIYSTAAALVANNSNVLISECWFDRNMGGAIYTSETNLSVLNTNFTNNECRRTFLQETDSHLDTEHYGGGAMVALDCIINVHDSIFINNTAQFDNASNYTHSGYSSAIAAYDCSSTIINESEFIGNNGCAIKIFINRSETFRNTAISRCNFLNNSGGAMYISINIAMSSSEFSIMYCNFTNNHHANRGGAIIAEYYDYVRFSERSVLAISESAFINNSANFDGGAVHIYSTYIYSPELSDPVYMTIGNCKFIGNRANNHGGAVYAANSNYPVLNLHLETVSFIKNSAEKKGATMYIKSATLTSSGLLNITNNMASSGVIFALDTTLTFSGYTVISNNNVSVYGFSSTLNFTNYTRIENNLINGARTQEGGALTIFQSTVTFGGNVSFEHNEVYNGHGGAVVSIESNMILLRKGNMIIAHNRAESGGGIYAHQSELNFMGEATIRNNTAIKNGGGIYAVGSSIKLEHFNNDILLLYFFRPHLQLINNKADQGGGIHLELNSKINLMKSPAECYISEHLKQEIQWCIIDIYRTSRESDGDDSVFASICKWVTLEFTNNSAAYGGALFISDETNSDSCNSKYKQTTSSECFLQQLALHTFHEANDAAPTGMELHLQNTHFTGNSATVYGDTIFGGLLDRCMLSSYSEIVNKYQNLTLSSTNSTFWISQFTNLDIDDIQREISSEPVRICYCDKNQKPDCKLTSPTYHIKKGESIKISLVAVDQVNNSVPSNVSAILSSHDGGLAEDQAIQRTTTSCTELTYNIYSPHDSEQLILYADGPCKDTGISRSTITVKFLPCYCPTGFVNYTHPSNCICDCDPELFPNFIRNCSATNETIERNGNVWINYINTTDKRAYVKLSHCPFDYCYPSSKQVWINLNLPNGADGQCAFNRSGKLCGSCEDGLSLSLGSSKCIQCSNNWLALLIIFAMTGVALVAFILVCNLTVAVGTINGLIFYANVIAANRAIFLPFDKPNVLTIFLAWLNLDFGFETCFFDGMDSYTKAWLQLVFPLYIISMVTAIIVISEYSFKFAALFRGKDPIATLATLILLSYTKLIRTIITSLSFTRLEYSDGSYEIVWLTDANVPYLKGKHIPLFITALFIVIIAMAYTLLLFGWQWINRWCPNVWITKNTKINSFFDTYHNPYNKDHRYWIGLLLIVRVLLYTISAVNILGDPRINLLSINSVVVILFFSQSITNKKITKRTMTLMLENVSLFNLIAFTIITHQIIGDKEIQADVAYVSLSVALAILALVLMYHAWMFVFQRKLQNVNCTLNSILSPKQNQLLQDDFSDSSNFNNKSASVTYTEINGLPENTDSETLSCSLKRSHMQKSRLTDSSSEDETTQTKTEATATIKVDSVLLSVAEFDAKPKAVYDKVKHDHDDHRYQSPAKNHFEIEECKLLSEHKSEVKSPCTSGYCKSHKPQGTDTEQVTETCNGITDDETLCGKEDKVFHCDETTPLIANLKVTVT